MGTPIRQGAGTVAYRNSERTRETSGDTDPKAAPAKDRAQSPRSDLFSGSSSFDASAPAHPVNGAGPTGVQAGEHLQGAHFSLDFNANASAGLDGVDVDVNAHVDASAVKAGTLTAKLEAGLDHFHASAYAAAGNVAGLLARLVSPDALLGDARAALAGGRPS